MARIEILVEEPSMKAFLGVFLPRILGDFGSLNQNVYVRSFEGKSDLQKNIPSKIKVFSNWHEPVAVVILHDQDSNDCKILKKKLSALCSKNGNCITLIRIVCKELESWYLGDFQAIQSAYPKFNAQVYLNKAKYREPDKLNAYKELRLILPEFQKTDGAKRIAEVIDIERNISESFQQTVSGLLKIFDLVYQNDVGNIRDS